MGKKSQGVVELQQHEVRGQQPVDQQHALGDIKQGGLDPGEGDKESGEACVAEQEDRRSSEVTVGEVLSGAPPESSSSGGSGGGV